MNRSAHAFDVLGKPVFFTPGITFGYTIGAGMNYGITMQTGFVQRKETNPLRYGLSFDWYFVRTTRYTHRLRALNVMVADDYFNAELGLGRAKNKWGRSNACKVHGVNADISFAYPAVYSPWAGFRLFRYNRANWAWFDMPYYSFYLGYKYDVIGNTALKKTSF